MTETRYNELAAMSKHELLTIEREISDRNGVRGCPESDSKWGIIAHIDSIETREAKYGIGFALIP